MQHFTILGNHNFGISLLMEIIIASYGNEVSVDIVAMFKEEENKIKDYLYDVPGIVSRTIHYEKWKRPTSTQFLNSGMSGKSRETIYNFFKENFEIEKSDYLTSSHPSAVISSTAKIGNGCYFGPNTTVAPYAIIGDFVHINRNSSLGHHMTIEDYVSISSGCNLASLSVIKKGVYIGVGSCVIDNVIIGGNTVIGAGSVVTKDIQEEVVAYGVPAKIIKKHSL